MTAKRRIRPLALFLGTAFLCVLAWIAWKLFVWGVIAARFEGQVSADCEGVDGACWVFIKASLKSVIYGFYPEDQRWRAQLFLALLALNLSWLLAFRARGKRLALALYYGLLPLIGAGLLYGGDWFFGLSVVPTSKWGGLLLSVLLFVGAFSVAWPLSLALAVARMRGGVALRWASIAFIELCRAVPLITILFIASVLMPFFLPEEGQIDKFMRAWIAMSAFAAAYLAEVVRGGLQTVAEGQREACHSLGMSTFQELRFVTLPQALRRAIPGLANTAIGLLKDTSLVLVIGMFDFLGMIQAIGTDSEWLGFAAEGYVFAAVVYLLGCYGIAWYSRSLEKRLSHGGRIR